MKTAVILFVAYLALASASQSTSESSSMASTMSMNMTSVESPLSCDNPVKRNALEYCRMYKDETCCTSGDVAPIGDLLDSIEQDCTGLTAECLEYLEYSLCDICDPKYSTYKGDCKDFCEYGADVCSGLDCGSLTSTSVSFDDKDCKGLGNSKCYGPLSPADESASTRTVAVAAITITLAAAAALF